MKKISLKRYMNQFAMPVVILFFILFVQLLNPQKPLLTISNITVILVQSSVVGLIALGLTLIVIAGETDMSLAGSVGLIGATFAMAIQKGQSIPVAILSAVLITAVIGGLYTVLIAKFGFSSIIISICLMFICKGTERLYNGAISIWITKNNVVGFANGTILGIPNFVVLMAIAYLACYVFINQTRIGFKIQVTGESPQAAVEMGFNLTRIKAIAFSVAFLLYVAASILLVLRVGGAEAYSGENYLLPAMTATFLGSSMFVPGKVNILGTLVGSLLMTFVTNFMTILGVSYYVVPFVQGSLLIIGIGLTTIHDHSIKQVRL